MVHARRKILRRVGLSVVLGALATWLVAWACAAVRPTDGQQNVFGQSAHDCRGVYLMPQHRLRTPDDEVFVDVFGTAVSTEAYIAPRRKRAFGMDDRWLLQTYPLPEDVESSNVALWPDRSLWKVPEWATMSHADSAELMIQTSAWGWPARCLSGTTHLFATTAPDGSMTGSRTELDGYWERPGRSAPSGVRLLPLRPIWPGYLINTALYGAVMLATMESAAFWRRLRRRELGLCPACGYDLHGTNAGAPCPECGKREKANAS